MKAPQNGSTEEFEKHPEGWVLGVCTRVIDTGTHWNDKKQKDLRKIMIVFESANIMSGGEFDGQPFLLFNNFNYSMYQNSMLCQFVENWRGRRFEAQDQADNFDLSKLIGQTAFMNIVHNENKFVNIQTIGPVPNDMTAPQPKGSLILVDQDNLDMAQVNMLTDKMKTRVMSSREQSSGQQQAAPAQSAPSSQQNPPDYGQPAQQSSQPPQPAPAGPDNFHSFDDSIPF